MQHTVVVGFVVAVALVAGCGDGGARSSGSDGGDRSDAASAPADLGSGDGASVSAADLAPPAADTLGANRDRLLRSYLQWLVAHPGAQTNGLDGATLGDVCALWTRLDPSSRATFETLTARLQGSRLADGSSALLHVARAYRVVGGQDATATAPGSCGGGEYNRMIVSIDDALHAALVAANQHQGAASNGAPDLADVAMAGDAWRDSHDAAGPHAPFDLSDETQNGAPRGQVQFFADPSSARAQAPLGRVDLMTLVDPHALEIDQDYDCVHSSNPLCSYVTYGPLCAPQPAKIGVDLYQASYGSIDASWQPSGC